MKKQKEEELGKKGSQVKSEETPCPEHKECENTDKKSCREEESCQKGEDKERLRLLKMRRNPWKRNLPRRRMIMSV